MATAKNEYSLKVRITLKVMKLSLSGSY